MAKRINTRIFIPTGKSANGYVRRWVWKRQSGLWVEYKDGITCRSDYNLRELLSSKYESVQEQVEN